MVVSAVHVERAYRCVVTGVLAILLVIGTKLALSMLSDVRSSQDLRLESRAASNAALDSARISGATVQIAVDPDCKFCEASFGFYRALSESRDSARMKVEVIASVPRDIASRYLQANALTVDAVRSVDFPSMGLLGTPTVRLLDAQGAVIRQWRGLLSLAEENEIVLALGIQSAFLAAVRSERLVRLSRNIEGVISPEELAEALSGQEALVVDTRSRTMFSRAHVGGSINIPIDEIEIRAPMEISRKIRKIAIFCDQGNACEQEWSVRNSPGYCAMAAAQLRAMGFGDVRLIGGSLLSIEKAGTLLESSVRMQLPPAWAAAAKE